MKTLTIRDLSYDYVLKSGITHALVSINAEFSPGTFYALTGRSGSGKTTLLSLLAAFDKPKQGDILLDGNSIFKGDASKYRREHVGMVFQSYNLIPHLTALENVIVSLDISKKAGKEKKTKAKEILLRVGVEENLYNKRPLTMSGGEQQRVAVARAIASDASVILADEPTGNLDNDNSVNIIRVLKSLAHEANKCVIVVTHSEEIAAEADVRYHLVDGRISLRRY